MWALKQHAFLFHAKCLRPGMNKFTAIIEKCAETGLYVGYVPGFPGAHSQGETLDELHRNLQEVIGMLLEDGEPLLEGEFVGTHVVMVA
jgi:predicted RNase H-like HicB family nuclease